MTGPTQAELDTLFAEIDRVLTGGSQVRLGPGHADLFLCPRCGVPFPRCPHGGAAPATT